MIPKGARLIKGPQPKDLIVRGRGPAAVAPRQKPRLGKKPKRSGGGARRFGRSALRGGTSSLLSKLVRRFLRKALAQYGLRPSMLPSQRRINSIKNRGARHGGSRGSR